MNKLVLAMAILLCVACADEPAEEPVLGPRESSLHLQLRGGVVHGVSAGAARALFAIAFELEAARPFRRIQDR